MTLRVGLIGYEPRRSWAAIAHAPALRALPGYTVTAVATRRQASADAAAADLGIDAAYDSGARLIDDPRVDLVVITVKVPEHYVLVERALAAGKHVYCEWPLGNGLAEAIALAEMARGAKGRAVVGMQARMSPAIDQARTLIAEGYVGQVLSTTLVGSGMQWGDRVDRPNAYVVDRANGATMLTIPLGHTVDALCHVLGEFTSLSAVTALRQPVVTRIDTGEQIRKTAHDQIVVAGLLESGAVASVHYRGGVSRGTRLLWEINGSEGDLQITAEGGHAQIFDTRLAGARGADRQIVPIASAPAHRWVPQELAGPAVNVAQMYARFADDVRNGTRICPDFDDAVRRHRMTAAIEAAAESGQRQSP